jgi:lactoylglutathione lyase
MDASDLKFRMVHENYNVYDLERSLKFYKEALGLTEKRRSTAPDGSYIIVFVGNGQNDYELELTWVKEHDKTYDLGEQEFHLAFKVADYEAAHELHRKMGVICFENPAIGIYFIQDPDGYWLEIIPEHR